MPIPTGNLVMAYGPVGPGSTGDQAFMRAGVGPCPWIRHFVVYNTDINSSAYDGAGDVLWKVEEGICHVQSAGVVTVQG